MDGTRRLATFSLTLATAMAAPSAAAQVGLPADRVRLLLSGAFDVSTLSYSHTITFTEFLEEGSLDTRYEAEAGPGFDVGAQIRISGGLGLTTSFSQVERDAAGTYSTERPHPLFFDQPRSASGDLVGLNYRERAVHMGLGYVGGSGRIDFALFGGASFFNVRADLVESLDVAQSYPFDDVSISGTRATVREDNPTGFHVGARVDYRFARYFGLGAQARFSRATARLASDDGSGPEIDAGGLQIAVGLRLYF